MSQSTAVRTRPVSRPAVRSVPAQRLRVVAAPPQTRSRAGLALACLGLLSVGLLGLLLLNVTLERGAYTLAAQQAQAQHLTETKQGLAEQLAALQAPQSLAKRAMKLGMVPAPDLAFIRPGDGSILGVASPASAPAVAATSRAVAGTVGATGSGPAKPGTTAKAAKTGKVGKTGTTTKTTKSTKPATPAVKSVATPARVPTPAPTATR